MEPATSSTSTNKSLLAALNEKYGDDGTSSENQSSFSFFFANVPKKALGKTDDGCLCLPATIGLESYGITCSGDRHELLTTCRNITELNIFDNRINSWQEVYTILDATPRLELFNLTRNPLPQLTSAESDRSYPLLKKLVLNFTSLTWETIGHILTVVPNLEDLFLSGNSYDSIMLDIPAYPSLRLLHLIDNELKDWKQVMKLDRLFPNLNNLILANNKLSSCGNIGENASIFTSLSVLSMSNNPISEWNELDKLAAIKSVSDIRLAGIPLLEGITDTRKRMQLLSVHFPKLKLVNGTLVANEDLYTAERVYLRHFEESAMKPDKFAVLEAKHGKLEKLKLAEVDLTPAFSISLVMECGDKQEVWDVPTKQTIGQLKKALRTFVGTSEFQMLLDQNFGAVRELHPSCYNRFIHSYRFQNGEKIICIKRDKD